MMKSYFSKLALAAVVCGSLVACNGDKKETDGSLLLPKDQQGKMEQIGIDMTSNLGVTPFEDAYEAMNNIMVYTANDYGVNIPSELYEHLADITETLEKNNIQEFEDLIYSNGFSIDYSKFFGSYTYDLKSEQWAYEPNNYKLQMNVGDYQIVASANSSSSSRAIEDVIPTGMSFELTVGDKSLLSCQYGVELSDEILPAKVCAVVSVGPYHLATDETISNNSATFSVSLLNDTKMMITATASVKGYDIEQGSLPSECTSKVNILNSLYVAAKVDSFEQFYEDMNEVYTSSNGVDVYSQMADIYNDNLEIKWNFADSFSNPAGFINFGYEYASDDYSSYGYIYPILVFSSDSSAYEFEDFFTESAFSTLVDKIEALIEEIEDSSLGELA